MTQIPDLTQFLTSEEYWAEKRAEEEEARWAERMPSIRDVEFYTGEFYGDR